MSKASKWAETRMGERPTFCAYDLVWWVPCLKFAIAKVDRSGRLNISSAVITPDSALSLARWILDTFGDD